MNAPLPAPVAVATTEAASRPGQALISLHAASVRLGDTLALDQVDLTLRHGQRLMLIGPNGSGKTTLLRLLHGLLPCSAGARRVHALQGTGQPPRMTMLFQRPFLLQLSVQRNLRLALWLAGVPAALRAGRVDAALARVGLADQAHRPAAALSGGQQQRLALARAWALQPDILFLDEPTASLDPGARREVEALIDDLAGQHTTVVMSTHHLGQAQRLATHVAYLEAGRLRALESSDRFFTQALPPSAAAFLRGEHLWL